LCNDKLRYGQCFPYPHSAALRCICPGKIF
jgi:hypothetical protein